MIIDGHGHWGPHVFTHRAGDLAAVHDAMRRGGIDVMVVSAIEAVYYDVAHGNASLAEILDGQPRLFGYVTADPRRVDLAAADLDRYLPSGRFVGVKVHTHYTRTRPSAPEMRDVFDLLEERGVPALVHTWGSEVVDLAEAVASYRRLRVIAGHSGGPGYRLAAEAARTCDRVWFEPCYSHSPAGRVRWLADHLPHERLLFGTDATLIDPSVALGAVQAAHLDDATLSAMFSTNALDFFDGRLDGSIVAPGRATDASAGVRRPWARSGG